MHFTGFIRTQTCYGQQQMQRNRSKEMTPTQEKPLRQYTQAGDTTTKERKKKLFVCQLFRFFRR
jgi:hypothetical protein